MLTPATPKKGSLLISEPFMPDPNFRRSVVLLTEHSKLGTMGYTLNYKSPYNLQEIVPEFTGASFPIYAGGPVGSDSLHFIHRCYDKLNSGTEIINGVYWGGNLETLKVLIENNNLTESEIRFFVGYSGWDELQLQAEIDQDTWLVNNNYDPQLLFSSQEEQLWKNTVRSLGTKYAHIANFPENPQWN